MKKNQVRFGGWHRMCIAYRIAQCILCMHMIRILRAWPNNHQTISPNCALGAEGAEALTLARFLQRWLTVSAVVPASANIAFVTWESNFKQGQTGVSRSKKSLHHFAELCISSMRNMSCNCSQDTSTSNKYRSWCESAGCESTTYVREPITQGMTCTTCDIAQPQWHTCNKGPPHHRWTLVQAQLWLYRKISYLYLSNKSLIKFA